MATIQHDSKNANKLIGNIIKTNTESDSAMCETTYLILDSVSQYINSDEEHKTDRQKCKIEEPSNNNDITETLRAMELEDSAGCNEEDDKNKVLKKNLTVSGKDEKHNIENKTIKNHAQIIPPAFTRWRKTLNNAQEILDQGPDIPIDVIAKYLQEKHAHETYVESLCKITGTNKTLQERNGTVQMNTRYFPMDNFLSYVHSEDGTQCLVCNMPVIEPDVHKYEVKHMNHVVKAVDHRGMRKLDYKYNHCIICNVRVRKGKETSTHIKKSQHGEIKKLLTEPPKQITNCIQNLLL